MSRGESDGPLVSIVIPALNEEGNIDRLESELLSVVDPLSYRFEFIVIDNHSTDRTGELIKEICARDSRWRYVRFSRNYTVEMSMTAGYQMARGDAIIVLYSDLQDPPAVIPRFLEAWEQGYDVVYGVRKKRPGDAAWRNVAVKLAYRLIAWSSEVPIPLDAGDFRLISRRVRDALVTVTEQNRYMRGLIAWLGFSQVGILYERQPRESGASKAPLWPTVLFTINAITSFSMKPLRVFLLLGLTFSALSALAIVLYTVLYFMELAPPGITTLIALSFLGIGLNSLGIGILGEYLGRTYTESKGRPLYVIEETFNLERNEFSEAPGRSYLG
jgi:polyisoprenyl-phosphate glycosyltransferase